MTSEVDSSILPSTVHTPQFDAYFSPTIAFNKNEQLPAPPAYTASTVNKAECMTPFTNPAAVINELDNQRSSVTTQRQLNSQNILRINQHIDNQGKKINDSLTKILCVAIFSILLGSIGIGLFVAYNNDLCDEYQTSSYCDRTYWALILGCIFIFLCISLIIVYCTMKAKLIRVKKLWQEKVVQLQQKLV